MRIPIKFDLINGVGTISENALENVVNRLCTIHDGKDSVYVPQFDITVKTAPYNIVEGCRKCVFNPLCNQSILSRRINNPMHDACNADKPCIFVLDNNHE